MKGKSLVFLIALISVFFVSTVSAADWNEIALSDIAEMVVKINDNVVWYGACNYNDILNISECSTTQFSIPALERQETAEIQVAFIANDNFDKVKVKAWITGYRDDIEDRTAEFDVFANNSYTKTLELFIPADIEAKDAYTLHVELEQKQELSGIDKAGITTEIQRIAEIIEILSVNVYSKTTAITAGSTAYVDVVVKNRGNHEAEDIYVKASIAELGISRTAYVGDLAPIDNDDEDTEKVTISLPVPSDAQGKYILEIEAYNTKTSDKETRSVLVGQAPSIPESTEVSIVPQTTTANIEQGKAAVYFITVTNNLGTTKNFIIEVVGTEDWATTQITPQAFTLATGESKQVNVYVAVNENAAIAEHIFTVSVKYDNKAGQRSLTANVTKQGITKLDTKTILMIVAIILGIIVIILLAVMLTRTKHKTEESCY